jgi:hypothetical protein
MENALPALPARGLPLSSRFQPSPRAHDLKLMLLRGTYPSNTITSEKLNVSYASLRTFTPRPLPPNERWVDMLVDEYSLGRWVEWQKMRLGELTYPSIMVIRCSPTSPPSHESAFPNSLHSQWQYWNVRALEISLRYMF